MECPTCGQLVEADYRFCTRCGTGVADPDAPPSGMRSGVRAQVFEVVVRQALAGASWREICAEPLRQNNIDPSEIEEEVRRRRGGGGARETAPRKPNNPRSSGNAASKQTRPDHDS